MAKPEDVDAPDMDVDTPKPAKRKRRHVRRVSAGLLMGLVLLAGVAVFLLMLGTSAPDFMRARFETRLNASLKDSAVGIGDIRVAFSGDGLNPSVIIHDLELRDGDGKLQAILPEIESTLSADRILRGEVRPLTIRIPQAAVNLTRDKQGRFDIQLGAGDTAGFLQENSNIAEIIEAIETAFAGDVLGRLTQIEVADVRVALKDDLSGRAWQFLDGKFLLENSDEALSASVNFKLQVAGDTPAEASFSWSKKRTEQQSEFVSKFSGVMAEDIADQVAVFDWLRVLKAPVAGSVSLEIGGDGSFGQMHGVLDIAAGSIRQADAVKPIRFTGAKAYLTYDPTKEKFTFNQISVNTDLVEVVAEGHAYLNDLMDRNIGSMIGQIKLTRIRIHAGEIFDDPVAFDLAVLDVRVRLSPLEIDIGQLVLVDDPGRYVLKGGLKLTDEGWQTSLDVTADRMSRKRLVDLWPLFAIPKTQKWVATNVLSGEISNITAAIRGDPGEKLAVNLGFDLTDANFRFMKTMPPVEGARGYGLLAEDKFRIILEQGTLTAPDGNEVNLSGSSFTIPDTRIKQGPAEVALFTQSSITSLLSVLDLKPFSFLSKGGVATDIAEGTIATSGTIGFPLVPKVQFDQVTLAIEGQIKNVSSNQLIKGKHVQAETLKAFANNRGITISGDAMIGAVHASGLWRQQFGPDHRGQSHVEGQIDLSQAFLEEFNIGLPKGTVDGEGTAHIEIDLAKGKQPKFRLRSDLNRIGLAIDALGWRKPANKTGSLRVEGQFGDPPAIDLITLEADDLALAGSVSLKPGGGLSVARFPLFELGGWMKTPLEIRPGPDGKAAFILKGGTIDFRKSSFGNLTRSTGGQGAGGGGTRITAQLDRLIVSSGIALTKVTGDLTTGQGGVSGSFEGWVNGGARIVGTLAPYNNGTAVRLTSANAGRVMQSAKLFESAVDGRMDMILVPTDKRGQYDGSLTVTNVSVRNATALANLLSTISVVGLLEQLAGTGIAFSDVYARFKLNPNSIDLMESSAVGASLGITMEGVYDFSKRSMDMQGVITPIYVLNGILEQSKIFGGLFGKQKGEGLFGFNYTLKGAVDNPAVGVNPLSLLTPGLFREIFRQPVPQSGQ